MFIGTVGRKYFSTLSCVLCKESVLISECPLLGIALHIVLKVSFIRRNHCS